MNENIDKLIYLHEIDQQIKDIQEKLKILPQKISELEQSLQSYLKSIENKKKQIEDNQKTRKKLEIEIETLQDKKNKYREQIKLIKTNKEYTALLQEINIQDNAIRAVEDEVLDNMESVENLQIELKNIQTDFDSEKVNIQKDTDTLMKAKEELEKYIALKNEERNQIAEHIPPNLLNLYTITASHRNGIAMAEIKDEICLSCFVRLRPQLCENIKKQQELFLCESCRRILYSKEP